MRSVALKTLDSIRLPDFNWSYELSDNQTVNFVTKFKTPVMIVINFKYIFLEMLYQFFQRYPLFYEKRSYGNTLKSHKQPKITGFYAN